jgi:hypothetical protein
MAAIPIHPLSWMTDIMEWIGTTPGSDNTQRRFVENILAAVVHVLAVASGVAVNCRRIPWGEDKDVGGRQCRWSVPPKISPRPFLSYGGKDDDTQGRFDTVAVVTWHRALTQRPLPAVSSACARSSAEWIRATVGSDRGERQFVRNRSITSSRWPATVGSDRGERRFVRNITSS